MQCKIKSLKPVLLVLVFLSHNSFVTGQQCLNKYQEYFDSEMYATTIAGAANNDNGDLMSAGAQLESLLEMYEATSDVKYLKKFSLPAYSLYTKTDLARSIYGLGKVWSCQKYVGGPLSRFAHPYHTALLTAPMARYAYIILNNTSIQSIASDVPSMSLLDVANYLLLEIRDSWNYHYNVGTFIDYNVAGVDYAKAVFRPKTQPPNPPIPAFLGVACDLITCQFGYCKYWDNTNGGYTHTFNPEGNATYPDGFALPMNRQAMIAKSLTYWSLAAKNHSNSAISSHYSRYWLIAWELGNTIRKNLVVSSINWPNHYFWHYDDVLANWTNNNISASIPLASACHLSPGPANPRPAAPDDISHGDHVFDYVYHAHILGVNYDGDPIPNSSKIIFSNNDMERLSNTIRYMLYDGNPPGSKEFEKVSPFLDHSMANGCGDFVESLYFGEGWAYMVPTLVKYAEFDPDLYHWTGDFVNERILISGSANSINQTNGCYQLTPSGNFYAPIQGNAYKLSAIGQAMMEDTYENKTIVGSSYTDPKDNFHAAILGKHWMGEASQWKSSTSSDFNGDNIQDIASSREYDNTIIFTKYDVNAQNGLMTSIPSIQVGYPIASIARVRTSTSLRYLAVLGKNNNYIDFYKWDSGSGQMVWSSSTTVVAPSNNEWIDIASGDVNNDNTDELILLDGIKEYVYTVSGTQLAQGSHGSGSDWKAVCAGDFDPNHPGDEYVMTRDFDHSFYMYEIDSTSNPNFIDDYYYGPGIPMFWKDMASGRLMYNDRDVFAAVADSDGDIYFYELNDRNIMRVGGEREYFPTTWDLDGICFANLTNDTCDVPEWCCPKEELVVCKNSTGDVYAYQLDFERVGCSETNPCTDDHFSRSADEHGTNLDVEINQLENFIKVYPNPTNSMLSLELNMKDLKEGSPLQLTVYSQIGSKLMSKNVQLEENIAINVEALSTGSYYLLIEHQDFSKRIPFAKTE